MLAESLEMEIISINSASVISLVAGSWSAGGATSSSESLSLALARVSGANQLKGVEIALKNPGTKLGIMPPPAAPSSSGISDDDGRGAGWLDDEADG